MEQLDKQHKSSEMHKKVKKITGQGYKQRTSNCIRDEDGKILFETHQIKSRWEEYVSELYNDNRENPPLVQNVDGEEILLSEVEKAVKELKSGKAPGGDQLTSEMIKASDEFGLEVIHKLVNEIYNASYIPSNMNESIFVRIPKTMCTEYRTLSLMSHLLKLILRIILLRNREQFEQEINILQSGFMTGKGTRDGIFNLRMINERYCEMNKEVYLCFIDYEKAFDRVNHEKLIDCLTDIGIDGKDVGLIESLYWTQKAYIRLKENMSDEIKIKRGVRQGCVLSPCLFNLYTEKIFRQIEDCKGVTIGGLNINNLRYADDTVLLADTMEDLQAIVNKINDIGKVYSMKINAKKTKLVVISRVASKPQVSITIDGTEIEQVAKFTYLGHLITEDGKCDDEIKRRIGIAKTTFCRMNKVLTSRMISLDTRKRIFQCYILSTLTYGAETWSISKLMCKRLKSFEIWCYRRMLRISWTCKVRNEHVYCKVGNSADLYKSVQIKKLKYFGHFVRHSTLQRTFLEGKVNGRRGRGRPRATWFNNISQWIGLKYAEAVRATYHRD